MDLNKLVNANQSIKIIPSIEDYLRNEGFNTDLDAETLAWLAKLKVTWSLWKRSDTVKCELEKYFLSSHEPYRLALAIVIQCEEYKDSKLTSLPYFIMQTLNILSINTTLPDDKLKFLAFQVAIQQRYHGFIWLVVKTYKILTINKMTIPTIKEMISKGNHKLVSRLIVDLELFNELPVQEILFPLILQDKTNVIHEYLLQCPPNVVEPFLQFLDGLLKKETDMLSYVQNYISENNVSNVKYDKLHTKPLGKFLAKLCTKLKYPVSNCKNLSKNRTSSGLRYLVYQKYLENSLTSSVWEDLVRDTLNQNPECTLEFIDFLAEYDRNEAIKWAQHFKISKQNYPDILKGVSESYAPQDEESWDDVEPSGSQAFYKLSLTPDAIIIIDTVDKFKAFTSDIRLTTLIGIDCEWKPSFGATQLQVALIQISTKQNVYLLDILSLNGQECVPLWHTFQNTFLNNSEIIKLGFGLEHDLKEMKASINGLSNIVLRGEGLLDLSLLWKRLSVLELRLPYSDDGGSLSSLVKSCFNLPLEKSERCSNWELRPLRQSQILYAALDSYVLLEVYTFLQHTCNEQGINFDEICNEIMFDVKPKNKKDRNPEIFEGETKPAESIKLLLDTKLGYLAYHLRCIGLDTEMYPATMPWQDTIYKAISDERYIVVSKLKFSPDHNFHQSNILKLEKTALKGQIAQIITYFKIIITEDNILSRCIFCNGIQLRKLTINDINDFNKKYKSVGSRVNNYNRRHEEYDDEPDFGNFLSDSDEDYPPPPPTNIKSYNNYKTSLGITIDFNNFDLLYESKQEGSLCETCGSFLWDGLEAISKTVKIFRDNFKNV